MENKPTLEELKFMVDQTAETLRVATEVEETARKAIRYASLHDYDRVMNAWDRASCEKREASRSHQSASTAYARISQEFNQKQGGNR